MSRNGFEFLFTQILEEVLDKPMVPGVVVILTFIIIVSKGNTHVIECWTGRLRISWDFCSLWRRRVSTTIVTEVHWVMIRR